MSQEVVKSGYLTKSPPQSTTSISFKNWRRRWFVLLDSSKAFPLAPRQVRLEYYTDETSASHCEKPKGVIDLRDCSGVVSSVKEIRGHKNVFNVVTKRRCYHLSADAVPDKEKWVFELQRIVNDCKSPQRYGMTTNTFTASSRVNDDATLAMPKLIPPVVPDKYRGSGGPRKVKSEDAHFAAGSPSKGVGSPSGPTSLTYDEDWDSDEETAGPMSVQSMSCLSSDDGSMSPRSAGTPTHTFGRGQSPLFSTASIAEPVRFGTGEFDDGMPDYTNMPDEVDDGIHDYYDYDQEKGGAGEYGDETEDGIADYDDPDQETEDGILDYANLDETGNHLKDTDDGIFDYADVAFPIQASTQDPKSSSRHPQASLPPGVRSSAAKQPYVNLGQLVSSASNSRTASHSRTSFPAAQRGPARDAYVNLDGLATGEMGGSRSGAAGRSHTNPRPTRSRSYAESDDDPILLVQMPCSLPSFGDEENGSFLDETPSGLMKVNSAGYINLPHAHARSTNSPRPASVDGSDRPPVPRKMARATSGPQPSTSYSSKPPTSARPKPPPPAKNKPAVRPRPATHVPT